MQFLYQKYIVWGLISDMYIDQMFSNVMSATSSIMGYVGNYIKEIFEKPKDIKDYYTVGKFMISKKLANTIFIAAATISAMYVVLVLPEKISLLMESRFGNRIYTKYNTSRALERYTGVAKVFSKRNDAVYEGDIKKGIASGKGILTDKNNILLYRGDFVNNEFTGDGQLYYPNGKTKYVGSFSSNEFLGLGKLFYPSGKLNYEGDFVRSMKDGKGILYNQMGTQIFKGDFANDRPVIEVFLGKETSSLPDSFGGESTIYDFENNTCVIYKEMKMMFLSTMEDKSIKESGAVKKIYVFEDNQFGNEGFLGRRNIDAYIDKKNGSKIYTGYAHVIFPEMAAIDYLRQSDRDKYDNFAEYDFDSEYKEVLTARKYKANDQIYIQAYRWNDLEYNFYFPSIDADYIFYSIERLS